MKLLGSHDIMRFHPELRKEKMCLANLLHKVVHFGLVWLGLASWLVGLAFFFLLVCFYQNQLQLIKPTIRINTF